MEKLPYSFEFNIIFDSVSKALEKYFLMLKRRKKISEIK